MSYQIKTPILNTSALALLGVISGVQSKTMDLADAKMITAAAGKIPLHVSTDLKVRIAAPTLAEIEKDRMTELPGKPFDVAELQPCVVCGQGVLHDGNVAFYEVKLALCVADLANIQRMHGLEQMMGGNVGIARVFSPDNSVARRLPETRALVCQPCLLGDGQLAQLLVGDHG